MRPVLGDCLQVEHKPGDEDRCQSGSTVAISLREEVEIGIGRASRRNPDNEGALVDRRARIADRDEAEDEVQDVDDGEQSVSAVRRMLEAE